MGFLASCFAWWKEASATVVLTATLVVGVPEEYYPAHRGYVVAVANEAAKVAAEANKGIRRSLGNLELQGMEQRRDNMRRQEFELGEKQQKEPTAERHQELLRVRDQLRDLDREIEKTKSAIP